MTRERATLRRRPLLAALLGAAALAALAAAGGARADHDGTHTLEGEYYWTGGSTGGDLRAVAAPAAWARRWPPRAVGRRGRDDGVAPAPVDTGVDRVERYEALPYG